MNFDLRGSKHTCTNCGAKFFDLNKDKVICPKCGKEQINKDTHLNTQTSKTKKSIPIDSKNKFEEDINFDDDIDESVAEDVLLDDDIEDE